MTGIEQLITQPAASGLIKIVLDLAKAVGSDFVQSLVNEKKAVEALKKYADKYQSRYGLLKLLGMPQAVKLESVYTPVRFLDKLSIRRFESIEVLERQYREGRRRKFQIGERRRQDGLTVANKNQFLMVLGGPGSGKSTFLRRVGLEAFKGEAGRFEHRCIPVMLELKRFKTAQVDLIEAITQEFKHFGFPPSTEFATKALEQGKLLVLLDGLDEVPKEQMNAVIESIHDFVAQYEQNRFMASCRIAAYKSGFQRFTDIELADFDNAQIRQFIDNWFQSERDRESGTAQKCWKTLNEPANSSAKELAQTPLLLTFLCLVYDNSQSFPSQRSRLYDEALDILLKKWAAEKRVQPGEIYEGLNPDLEKVLLSEFAYQNFVGDRLFFSEQELVNQIKDFLADTLKAPQHLDGEAVLDAIATQQGILVERAEDIFSFSHLTLQEYLTAQYISQRHRQVPKLVAEHLTNKRWREVFLLVAGLMPDADELLEMMEQEAQQFINTYKLNDLLYWADLVTAGLQGYFKPVVKRAVAIAGANALALADTYAYSKADTFAYADAFALALAEAYEDAEVLANADALADAYADAYADTYYDAYADALDKFTNYARICAKFEIYRAVNLNESINILEDLKARIPDRYQPLEERRAFAKQLLQTLLKAFDLEPEQVNLSTEELKALDNYCYANLLVVQCKDAAVRVSRQKWEEIEERMLLPQSKRTL